MITELMITELMITELMITDNICITDLQDKWEVDIEQQIA